MKYLCLAYEEEDTLNILSRDEWDLLRSETLAYVEDLRKRGHLISAEALQSVRTATTLRVRAGQTLTHRWPLRGDKGATGGIFSDRRTRPERSASGGVAVAFGETWQHRGAPD